MRAFAAVLGSLFVAVSCYGQSDNDDDDSPRAGAAGASSAAAAGASAGTSNAGSSSGGSGGQPSQGGAECESDADCRIVESCCSCFPAPVAEEFGVCDAVCEQSACGARGLGDVTAICSGNRCVFELSCDRTQVTCRAAEPTCPDGQIASVQDSCWGPCVQPSECSAISGCDYCPAGSNQVCVTDNSSPLVSVHCVEVTSACAETPSCECVAACFAQCDDARGIGCFCINC